MPFFVFTELINRCTIINGEIDLSDRENLNYNERVALWQNINMASLAHGK